MLCFKSNLLISFIFRKGSSRTLTIRKKDGSETAQSIMTFNLSHNSKHAVRSLLQRFPITNKERTDLLPRTERGLSVAIEAGEWQLYFRVNNALMSMGDLVNLCF